MSEGLKKVATLVMSKFDKVLEQKIKLMVSLEAADLELRLDRKYLKNQNAAAPVQNSSIEYQNQKSTRSLITKTSTAKTV